MRYTGTETELHKEKDIMVKQSPCLITFHSMKMCGAVDLEVHTTSALDENELPNPDEKSPPPVPKE
jgi:hypothetical protein